MKQIGCWITVLTLGLVAGCGPKPPVDYLVMGTNAEFPPFEMRGGADNSAVVGFDVTLAQAIAEEVGKPLKVEEMPFEELIPALVEGRLDLVLAGLTITEERAALVDFSDPYYTSTQVALIRKGDPVPAVKEDLRDRKVGAPSDTTGAAAAASLTSGKRRLRTYNSALATVVGLMNSRVDFALVDEQPAIHFQKRFQKDIQMVRLDFDEEFYGVAVPKGNAELLAQVNEVLADIRSDGRMEEWLDQWMVQLPEAAAATEE
jgi:arginine/lysine/histidine transporter system substrate-binding protein